MAITAPPGTVLAALVLLAAPASPRLAAQAAAGAPPARTAIVQDFTAVLVESQPQAGVLSRMKERRQAVKTVENAAALSNAIVKELGAAGFAARRLEPGTRLPAEGWLIRGVFHALDSGGGVLPHLGGPEAPNAQVSVTVADLAVDPAVPFAVFGNPEALKGQGLPVGWNPYVVAAKIVVNRAQAEASIDKVAKEIVDAIVKSRAELEERKRAQRGP